MGPQVSLYVPKTQTDKQAESKILNLPIRTRDELHYFALMHRFDQTVISIF